MLDADPEHPFLPGSLLHARRKWPLGPMTRRCPPLDNVSSR
jgi:hypothetical protein